MEGPTPVSALIHAATMVTAGVYLLHRTAWLFALTPDVLLIVAWIGAFTALLAAVLACVQDDIKRVLAYSTVSQLGYMMTAIGAGFSAAGFFHLLTHGVFKALLFLGAGAVIHAVHSNDLPHMGGLARKMPQTAIVFLIGTLSLAGIPLFAGFLSKEEILGADAGPADLTGPFVLLLIVAFLTAFYMFRVVFLAFFGSSAGSARRTASTTSTDDPRIATHAPARPAGGDAAAAVGPGAAVAGRRASTSRCRARPDLRRGRSRARAGVADAGRGRRRRRRHPARVADLSAPRDQRRAGSPRCSGRSAAPRSRSSGSTTSSRRSTACALLAFSRVIGWLDRYIVDGVLNVVSAWTLTARRRAAADPDRPGAGLRLRRRRRPPRSHPLDAVGAGVTGLPGPLDHHVGAVRRGARHHGVRAPPAAARALDVAARARRSRSSRRSGCTAPTTASAAGFQFASDSRSCRRSASPTSSAIDGMSALMCC